MSTKLLFTLYGVGITFNAKIPVVSQLAQLRCDNVVTTLGFGRDNVLL